MALLLNACFEIQIRLSENAKETIDIKHWLSTTEVLPAQKTN